MDIAINKLTIPTQLNRVLDDVFDEPINPDFLSSFLNCPRHVMFIACDRDIVVGMISGVEYFHPDKAVQMWINEIGVAPDYRGRKIGRNLVQKLIDYAEAKGCTYAWLGTDADNTSAQACFNAVPEGEPPQAFFLYEWDLED